MAVNSFLQFAKYAGDPKKALFINDVDLAFQDSMCTKTTEEQRQAFWDLYKITEGGFILFTGRTPQSAQQTYGHDYPGVFEHYALARFGLGQSLVFMSPKADIEQMAGLTAPAIVAEGSIRIAETPTDIRESSDSAVFIEKKNASIALVHTTLEQRYAGDPAPLAHLESLRRVLIPIAEDVIAKMGISNTHIYKQGNDAIEIVPKGLDPETEAKIVLSQEELQRIHNDGLSKATALHNFYPLFKDRAVHMLGDGAPDMDVAVEIKKHYDGWGTYVSNGVPLQEEYRHAVMNKIDGAPSIIDNHSMTWPMVIDAANELKASMPKFKMPLPKAGGMVPDLRNI